MILPKLTFRTLPIATFLIAALLSAQNIQAQSTKINVLKITSAKDLRDYFRYTGKDVPLISGHRGGMVKGFPENSIATFKNTLSHTPAYFEIDPRFTKDSVAVILHDATLDRTTTGTGKLSDYTWEEVKKLRLKDPEGNVTPYGIPTLEEVIRWSKGKTLINLDKKDLSMEKTAAILKKHNAYNWVMITVHNAEQAKFYYDKNKNTMFSAWVLTKKAFDEYDKSGIPWSNFVAYVGPEMTAENKELCKLLHEKGVMCMIGAGPSYDKLPTAEERKVAYQEIIKWGADVIETDLPVEAAEAIRPLIPVNSTKQKFFNKKVIK